jgi:hypothetical protein
MLSNESRLIFKKLTNFNPKLQQKNGKTATIVNHRRGLHSQPRIGAKTGLAVCSTELMLKNYFIIN